MYCGVLRCIAMCCDVLSEVEASEVEASKAEVNATWYYVGSTANLMGKALIHHEKIFST